MTIIFGKSKRCLNGFENNNYCLCNLGWYHDKNNNCTNNVEENFETIFFITKYLFTTLFAITTILSLTITIKLHIGHNENHMKSKNIKRLWTLAIFITSFFMTLYSFDLMDDLAQGLSQLFFLLSLISLGFVHTSTLWHWIHLYKKSYEKMLNQSSSSPSDRQDRSNVTKRRLDRILIIFFINNIFSILMGVISVMVWFVSGKFHHQDLLNFLNGVYFMSSFIITNGSFIVYGPYLAKNICIKSVEKYKLFSTSRKMGTVKILFITTWIPSTIIYFTSTESPVVLFIFWWITKSVILFCLFYQLMLFFKRVGRFPFLIWKKGRSFSPKSIFN